MASSLVLTVFLVAFFVIASKCKRESTNKSCPTWLYRSEEGWCTCGSSLLNVILCNNVSQTVSVANSYCLTSFDPDHEPKEPVVGRCLYVLNHGKYIDGGVGLFYEVDQNISQQDHQLCDYLNREGRLCGACKANHFISPYSYDLKCYQCRSGLLSNIIIYLTVAYIPLTIFLVLVVAFHISATSPHLNLAILLCQVYALPTSLRIITQVTRNTPIYLITKIFPTVYGIWNLDFFRALVPPICLPLTTMQVIALDYLVAVYPLLLLVCFYVLVTAHGRGCRLVVRLWRPFLWCSARIRQVWDIRNSIIDAFATFLLLSYVKFLSVSGTLLLTTPIFDIRSRVGYFMFYDPSVEFMGEQHMPYFIISMTVLIIAISFPLLLILYPMKWFQVFLNKCHLNSPGLRMFMECFQGYYRDRTDGGWECRYFAALYQILRFGGPFMYNITLSEMTYPLLIFLATAATFFMLLINPYKKPFQFYIKIDLLLTLSYIVTLASLSMSALSFDWNEIVPAVGFVLAAISSLVPFVYFTVLMFKSMGQVFKKRHCFKQIAVFMRRWHARAEQPIIDIDRETHEEFGAAEQLIQSAS